MNPRQVSGDYYLLSPEDIDPPNSTPHTPKNAANRVKKFTFQKEHIEQLAREYSPTFFMPEDRRQFTEKLPYPLPKHVRKP